MRVPIPHVSTGFDAATNLVTLSKVSGGLRRMKDNKGVAVGWVTSRSLFTAGDVMTRTRHQLYTIAASGTLHRIDAFRSQGLSVLFSLQSTFQCCKPVG